MFNYIKKNYALRGYPRSIEAARKAVISYSQFGEDLLLQNYLGFLRRDVHYLDIGAYHPIQCSNTYLSYLKGGKGVAVEPNPQFREAWQKYRSRDTFLNVAVSPSVDGQVYYHSHPSKPALNFVATEPSQQPHFQIRRIECISIGSLVQRYREALGSLDVVSIDCEGLDLELLLAFPLKNIRPKAFVVEDFDFSGNSQIDCFMQEHGYQRWAQLRVSKIFVDSLACSKP